MVPAVVIKLFSHINSSHVFILFNGQHWITNDRSLQIKRDVAFVQVFPYLLQVHRRKEQGSDKYKHPLWIMSNPETNPRPARYPTTPASHPLSELEINKIPVLGQADVLFGLSSTETGLSQTEVCI